jgi:iron complex transport system substrate-binding protein
VALLYTPRRIVSLQPSATAILQAIGQLDRLVACTRYCVDVCAEAASGRIIVADSWSADAVQIRAAKPDLVIAAVPYQETSVTEILKSGTRFLGLAPRTLADVYTDIATIAGIVGVPDRGQQVADRMATAIDEMRRQTSSLPRRRVFCEEWGKPLITSQPWVAELVEAAGGEFIGTPGKQTTAESVHEANPDVIVAAWCGAGDRVPLEKIVRDRHWTNLAAVQAGRVYCIRDELLNTPAPTLIQGLHALAGAIHPEHFPPVKGLRALGDVSRETRSPGGPVV